MNCRTELFPQQAKLHCASKQALLRITRSLDGKQMPLTFFGFYYALTQIMK